ncbi:unnamed protein product [Mesocestoides corti]|uniref:Uncharacterized protein n=1 Tax=Mesocestoides corti TaxID=53468 RepID=A0A0R3UKZ6_MESCO|nr:unnamed protein product [Mesocestoides corti]
MLYFLFRTADDPAASCPELRKRLQENAKIAAHKLNSILTRYSRLQDDLLERVTSTSSERLDDSNQASVKNEEEEEEVDVIEVGVFEEDDGDASIGRSAKVAEAIPLPTTHLDANIISPYFTEKNLLTSASTSASSGSPSKSQPLGRLTSPTPQDSSSPANDTSPPPCTSETRIDTADDRPETASCADDAPAAETAEAADAPEVITISDDDNDDDEEPEVVSYEWNAPRSQQFPAFHALPGSSVTNRTVTRKASRVRGGGYVISASEEQSVVRVVPSSNAMEGVTTQVVQQRREQQFYIPPSFNPFRVHRF